MTKPLFTVFTPTYNRAKTLHRTFKSLLMQTFRDFEWLIVDDGSTDNTEEIIKYWMKDSNTWFPIRYIRQDHGHKKKAVNRGVKEAEGELFLIADSDDAFLPDALDRFVKHWFSIPEKERTQFAGVVGLCVDEDGNIVDGRFPCNSYMDCSSLEMKYKYKSCGERWGFVRTDIMRQYPYPEDIEGHVPESVVWDEVGRRYKNRWVNEVFRIFYQEGEDRITKTRDPSKGAEGHLYWKWFVLSQNVYWFRYEPGSFLLEAARLVRFYLHCPATKRKWFWPTSFLGKGLVLGMCPVGVLWWLKDKFVFR